MRNLIMYVALLALSVGAAHAQEVRSVTETAGEWARFECHKNADASIECTACVRVVSSEGTSREQCSELSRLSNATNINRADNLGDALRARALRKFGVDGGAP